MNDHIGAALIYPKLQDAGTLVADKGYGRAAFRDARAGRGITPCIPPRAKRQLPATNGKTVYRRRHKVENMFARLKDWRRISMRCASCGHTFFGAISIAPIVIFWLGQCVLTLVEGPQYRPSRAPQKPIQRLAKLEIRLFDPPRALPPVIPATQTLPSAHKTATPARPTQLTPRLGPNTRSFSRQTQSSD